MTTSDEENQFVRSFRLLKEIERRNDEERRQLTSSAVAKSSGISPDIKIVSPRPRGFRHCENPSDDTVEKDSFLKRFQIFRAETESKAKELAAEEKVNDSDASAEWNIDIQDRKDAEEARKRWTKSRRKRERHHVTEAQIVCHMQNLEKNGFKVEWNQMDNPDFDSLSQCFYLKPVPLYIARFMDVCYPPLLEEVLVTIAGFKERYFYCSWKEIEEELHAFERLVNNDETGMKGGIGMWDVFPGDVILVRAGSKNVEWKRGLVKQVFKRAEFLEVYLVEYGMELVKVQKCDCRHMKDIYFSTNPRGRIFFTCRFRMTGHDFCTESGVADTEKLQGLVGQEVKIFCHHYENKISVGQMFVRNGNTWCDLLTRLN